MFVSKQNRSIIIIIAAGHYFVSEFSHGNFIKTLKNKSWLR